MSLAVALTFGVALSVSAQDVTLHGGTSVVLVPTLVTDSNGEPVFGLSASNFAIYDNGAEQKVQLDETFRSQPISVVVAIEKGHSADETLDKIKRVGSLLYPIVGEGKGEAAVVAFDSKPVLMQDFTGNVDLITAALNRISVGDYNAASLDAISYSTALLEARSPTNRKVLFLICEPTDRGSVGYDSRGHPQGRAQQRAGLRRGLQARTWREGGPDDCRPVIAPGEFVGRFLGVDEIRERKYS